MKPVKNIFSDIPGDLPDELLEILAERAAGNKIKIERIISRGHSSRPGFWYDQENSEFVILLRGKAAIIFKDPDHTVEMRPGDYIDIPAHTLHRVEWTSGEEDTVWLAVHY